MTKNEEVKVAMMCWEVTNNFPKEEPNKEPEKVEKKPIEKTEKPKHEERTCQTYTEYRQLNKNLDQRILLGERRRSIYIGYGKIQTTTVSVHHEPQEWFTEGWYKIV